MKGTYEYKTLKSPYQPMSEGFNNWLRQQYEDGEWELVCPVNNYISSGNSRDDYMYIFRKYVSYECGI